MLLTADDKAIMHSERKAHGRGRHMHIASWEVGCTYNHCVRSCHPTMLVEQDQCILAAKHYTVAQEDQTALDYAVQHGHYLQLKALAALGVDVKAALTSQV